MDSGSYERAQEQIDEYLGWMAKRGRKAITLESVGYSLGAVVRFLHGTGRECEADRVDEDGIMALVTEYPALESTVRKYTETLGGWLRHYGNGVLEDMALMWNGNARSTVRWIDEGDFRRLLEEARDPADRIILMLASYGGMRRGEIANLRTWDIGTDTITVTGKGHGNGKVRVLPLTNRLRSEIERYRAYRDRYAGEIPQLVIVFDTKHGKAVGITPDTVGARMTRLCRRAGVDATAHSLRRYFATEIWHTMPEKDITVLQRLLGHAAIGTTALYIREDAEAMRTAMERL